MKQMKLTKITKVMATLVIAVALSIGVHMTANAAYVSQTAQTQDSITIFFDSSKVVTGSSKLTGWSVTLQKYDDNYNKVDVQPAVTLTPDVTTYTLTGLTPGTEYIAKVGYTYVGSTGKTSTYDTTANIYTMPGKVTGVNQVKWWYYAQSVDFGWDKQDACKYEWVAYQGKKQAAKNDYDSSYNSGSFKIKNNKLYTVKVRAYVDINGQKVYGDWSDSAYLFTQPMISNGGVKINSKGQMTVKWGKISGVDSYEVYVSTKETKGYKKVAKLKASKGSVTIKKFKKKAFNKSKTYFVYIMAKKKVGGKTYTSGRHYATMYKKGSSTLRWSFDKSGK